jgi:hypothetical protein
VTPSGFSLLTFIGSPDPMSTLEHEEHSAGYGAGAPGYLDSQVSSDGNYVKYSGLTSSVFTLMALPAPRTSSAAINGFEIVGYDNVPEPSTSLVLVLASGLLVFRGKRSEFTRGV